MSVITIEIKAPELCEAILTLASALAIGKNSQNPSLQKPVEEIKKAKNAGLQPDKEPTIELEPPAGSTSTDEIPSVVDLRANAQEKGKTAEGKKAIKDLLNEFESKSISDVPEEKRAAFMAALEAL